jgi:hypothetical protein
VKTLAALLVTAVLVASCDGQSEVDQRESAFTANFVAYQASNVPSMIQQVPIATARNACRVGTGCGTMFTFATDRESGQLVSNPFRFVASTAPQPGSGNDVGCIGSLVVAMNQNLGTLGTSYFPASYGIPNVIGASSVSHNVLCTAAGNSWSRIAAVVYTTWAPFANVNPSAASPIIQRADVDFPEYGVTNRYYWLFQ